MPYDDLVKRLRAAADNHHEKCDGCPYEEDYPCCVDCLDKIHKEAADAIEELLSKLNHDDAQIQSLVEAAEERRWIPVTERLPRDRQFVLVYCGDNKRIRPSDRFDVAILLGDSIFTSLGVTHWMPLPEPTEEE